MNSSTRTSVQLCLFLFLGTMTNVLSSNLFGCDVADFYEGFEPDNYEDPSSLKEVLHDYVDDHIVIPYYSAAAALRVLDAYEDGVRGIYSLEKKTVYPTEWNKEHLWPRSIGLGNEGADYSDLHNLRPCDATLNSNRQNKFFDECVVGVGDCTSPAGSWSQQAAQGSSESRLNWAPPPSVRGDIARSVFYMAVRYDGSDNFTTALDIADCGTSTTCSLDTFGRLSTLLRWHLEDPVSTEEEIRNELVCTDYQGNRNPFVDFPELVERIFGANRNLRGGQRPKQSG